VPQGLDISEDNPRLPDLSGIGGVVLTAILLGGAVTLVAVVRALPHLFSFLDRSIANKTDFEALCALLAVGVGIGLYVLRLRIRWVYAAIELCFAFSTAWVAVARLHSQGEISVWFGFMGSAYLIVRALDNFAEARKRGGWPWKTAFEKVTGVDRVGLGSQDKPPGLS
jgi:hypothetical protein